MAIKVAGLLKALSMPRNTSGGEPGGPDKNYRVQTNQSAKNMGNFAGRNSWTRKNVHQINLEVLCTTCIRYSFLGICR